MRANRREPVSVPFWFQSLKICQHHRLLKYLVARMAASYIREQGLLLQNWFEFIFRGVPVCLLCRPIPWRRVVDPSFP